MKNKKLYFVVMLIFVLFVPGCSLFESETAQLEITSSQDALSHMQGFWYLTGENNVIYETAKITGEGVSIKDNLMDIYSDFEIQQTGVGIEFEDIDTFILTVDKSIEVNVSFEIRDGYELMIWESDKFNRLFEKIDYEKYMLYKGFKKEKFEYDTSIYLSDDLSDMELAWYISDISWTELYYLYADGTTGDMDPFNIELSSLDSTGVFGEDYVTWEVYEGDLYLTYKDDGTYYYSIDYLYDNESGYAYLYLYNMSEEHEGDAWVFYYLNEEQ